MYEVKVKVAQLCLTLCDPMDYTVHGILQARILERVAYPFSKGSSQPRDGTGVSCIAGGFLTSWATMEAQTQKSALWPTDTQGYNLFEDTEIVFFTSNWASKWCLGGLCQRKSQDTDISPQRPLWQLPLWANRSCCWFLDLLGPLRKQGRDEQ